MAVGIWPMTLSLAGSIQTIELLSAFVRKMIFLSGEIWMEATVPLLVLET